jgi:hypothetical protein
MFEFQIQTLFFYSNQVVGHLFCNLKSYIQMYSTKFTFVKIMWRWNFREIIRFFQKGLNSFKIQTKFKCGLFSDFLFKFCWGFEILPKRKVVPFEFVYCPAKFGNLWNLGSSIFIFWSSYQLNAIGKYFEYWKRFTGPGPLFSAVQFHFETGLRPHQLRLGRPTRPVSIARAWASFRPRADADRQRCVPTAPAVTPTCATCLPASTRSACNHHPCAPPCTLIRCCSPSTIRSRLLLSARLASAHSSPLPCRHCTAAPKDPLATTPWAPHHRRAGAPNLGASQRPAWHELHVACHELCVACLPLPRSTPRRPVTSD